MRGETNENGELMETLNPLIQQLVKMLQGGADVVNGQLPDVANQIIRLYLWCNVIEIPILIGIMVAGWFAAKWIHVKNEDINSEPWFILWLPIGVLEIIIGCYAYGCTQTMLKAIFAPKLLVIEVLSGFLK